MRPRRGFALLAALWLVVAIAAIALQFSIEARERRAIGILASERGIQHAAALGGLALMQARLEEALRLGPSADANPGLARLRATDPWFGADSVFSGPVLVDSMEVAVQVRDLGEKLNVNRMSEVQLQTFFSFLLKDFSKSTQLSQAIMDWRDADSIPRPSGAERDAYIKEQMLALPTNAPFREIEELQDVMGMTPDIYAQASPYLTTHGTTNQVNLNSAPVPVLRALPGMTDVTLNLILQMRSQGRRINNVADVFGGQASQGRGAGRAGGGRAGQLAGPAVINQLQTSTTTTTTELEVTIISRAGPQAPPSKLTAIVRRQGNNAIVQSKQW
jgi:general secretion pathway protein K